MSKPWGQPVLSIRISMDDLRRLKYLARERSTTVTDIVRALITDHLEASGVSSVTEELPGQIHFDE